MTASREAVLTALKTVTDPATGTDIVASGVMRARNVDDAGAVRVVMDIPPAPATAYEEAEAQAEAADEEAREFQKARRYGGTRSPSRPSPRAKDGFGDAIATAVIKELKGTTGRRLVRGILGGLFKGR